MGCVGGAHPGRHLTCGARRAWSAGGRRPVSVASELQGLRGQELLETEAPALPAVAGLLEAAERRLRVVLAAVDLDLPGANAARDLLGVLGIAGPHGAREAEVAVVR